MGNFIMFRFATDGQQANNRRFSTCSLDSIHPVLQTKSDCFECKSCSLGLDRLFLFPTHYSFLIFSKIHLVFFQATHYFFFPTCYSQLFLNFNSRIWPERSSHLALFISSNHYQNASSGGVIRSIDIKLKLYYRLVFTCFCKVYSTNYIPAIKVTLTRLVCANYYSA